MDLSPPGIGARVLRTRWLVRAPIALFRAGLGWMLGRRVLMLEHRGRTSGQRRFVCLEIVDQPDQDRITVVSGFGERAQWYRNLQADPHCFVSTGTSRRVPATARFLSDEEAAATLDRYRERYPRDWALLLLVPVVWTRRALLMSATCFYEKAVLDLAQLEQAVVGSDGKLIKTPKDELMKQPGLGRGRNTNIRLTLKASAQDENLIAYFTSFVAAKFDHNDNDAEAAAA